MRDCLFLSVLQADRSVLHYVVRYRVWDNIPMYNVSDRRAFTCLDQLVEHYKRDREGPGLRLGQPFQLANKRKQPDHPEEEEEDDDQIMPAR